MEAKGEGPLLAYAMLMLGMVATVAVVFSLEGYLGGRHPRDIYLFVPGWSAYALSLVAYWFASRGAGSLPQAAFGALQLLAICLILAGVFSYFIDVSHRRVLAVVLASGVLIGGLLFASPELGMLIIPAENALMFGAAVFGLARRKRMVEVGGKSYYALIFLVVIGLAAAVAWAGQMDAPMGTVVWPWLGTTATVLTAVIFMAQLRISVAMSELRAREHELVEHHELLERRVAERTADLEEANRVRERFFARVTHELRTPLNSIIGYSSLMHSGLAGPVTDQQRSYAEVINVSGERLLSLVDELLELSGLEARRGMAAMWETFDSTAVVGEVVATLRPRATITGSEIVSDTSGCDQEIRSNPDRLRRILLILGENAIEHADAARIDISCRVEADGASEFSVIDAGRGIDPEALPHIFDAFVRGEEPPAAGRRETQGAGLGLTLARELSTLLGGELRVWSEPGRGSTFTLSLPADPDGRNRS